MTVDRTEPDEALIRRILQSVRTIALVGASPRPERPAYQVQRHLQEVGYWVHPVNPGQAGKKILGRRVYASLAEVPVPIDMVDIFRNSEAAARVVDEALGLDPLPRVIWMQIGVRNERAAARAREKGVIVIMDRCPKIEHARLLS